MSENEIELQRWSDVLTSLESHLEVALRQAADATPVTALHPWEIPGGLGPMPAELVERASLLLTEQAKAIVKFRQFRLLTAQHLSAVRDIMGPHQLDTSYYLDIAG